LIPALGVSARNELLAQGTVHFGECHLNKSASVVASEILGENLNLATLATMEARASGDGDGVDRGHTYIVSYPHRRAQVASRRAIELRHTVSMITQLEAVTQHNEQVAPDFRTICRDLVIDVNGVGKVRIVDFVRTGERIIGDVFASWKVLVERNGSHDPFVVWTLVATDQGFVVQSGSYCATLEQARKAYESR
jgi:hypothetical protein